VDLAGRFASVGAARLTKAGAKGSVFAFAPTGYKKLLLTRTSALFWSIWLTRNEVAFNHKPIPSIVQVIFRGTHWFRFWRLLQKKKTHQQILDVCQASQVIAMEVFANHGWRSNARLECG
jgi:hypothetical protein